MTTEVGPVLAAQINALPPMLKDYVRNLEMQIEPAGYLAENAALIENIRYLCLIVQRQRQALLQFGVEYP